MLMPECVEFVLVEPLVHVQSARGNERSEHDKFFPYDVKMKEQRCGPVLKPVGHCHMFCTSQKFEQCYRALAKESDEEDIVTGDGEQGLRLRETQVSQVFVVHSTPAPLPYML